MKKKFYAVKKGRKTGIFLSWAECERQVKGFPKAEYKSFTVREDAENYLYKKKHVVTLEGKEPDKKHPASGQAPKYYAVLRGRKPGVYTSWENCKKQCDGFPYAEYKSFRTREEAEKYYSKAADTQSLLEEMQPTFWMMPVKKPVEQYTAKGPDYNGIPDEELAGCLRILYRASHGGGPVNKTPSKLPASSALP
ncbi:MAG: RNase H1/viroplasmin domain-containing protein [Clostridiales bacterium]|nr:RNase H1/viroplasmin domain-containing protein [Clostridiales bacterium]